MTSTSPVGEALSRVPAPERTIAIGPELQLKIRAVLDPASIGDQPVIDLRLFHRSGKEWMPGHQGLEVPVRLAAAAVDAIQYVAVRAAHLLAMAPPKGP